MRRFPLVAAVLVLAVTVACGRGAATSSAAGFTTHDSAGVEIVDNTPTADAVLQIDTVPLTAIGGDDSDPQQQFSRVLAAHRTADGRVVVATDKTVLLFGADGKFVKTISRNGEGPGEFRYLDALYPLAGDTIMLADGMGRQVAWYTADGTLVREQRADLSKLYALGHWAECRGGILPDGSHLVCSSDPSIPATAANRGHGEGEGGEEMADPGPGLLRQLYRQYVVPPTLDTAYKIGIDAGIEQFGIAGGKYTEFLVHPFYSWSLLTSGGSPLRIASMLNPEYRIEIWTPQGKLVRVIRRANGRRAPTEEEKKLATASMLERTRDTAAMLAKLAKVPTPDSLPAAIMMIMSAGGDLAVMREGFLPGQTASLFDIFDANGRWTGELHLPPRTRLFEVGADYILYAHADEDDVPHIEVHRLKSPLRG